MFFDSHAHLDDKKYDGDRDAMMQRARDSKISNILNVGYDLPSSRRSLDLAGKYDFIYAAVGVHPHDAAEAGENYLQELQDMAVQDKVVAIGEMGLDYYRNLSPKEIQQRVFREQIRLAAKLEKPIIIHDREAHGDVMDILREEDVGASKGVLHCFSGSLEMARECLEMGFYLSIAGPVTFHNANKLRDVAANVPLNRLLIETDAPYLTPEPHRGKRNESAYVAYVGKCIAEIRGISVEELANATSDNAKRLFKIG